MAADIIRMVGDSDNKLGFDKDGNLVHRFGGRFAVPGQAFTATAVKATDGANATLVTITLKDVDGTALAAPHNFDLWLSDSTIGEKLTATTASGNVQGKTNGTTGTDLTAYVAKKALRVQSLANGTYQLSITDTSKTAFKIVVQLGANTPIVVATLATGDYG